jgi:hypothetical protein
MSRTHRPSAQHEQQLLKGTFQRRHEKCKRIESKGRRDGGNGENQREEEMGETERIKGKKRWGKRRESMYRRDGGNA